MVLYICLMASIKSVLGSTAPLSARKVPARPSAGSTPICGMMPRTPGDFRVVLTFHHADGKLCEAALTPLEASMLVSEVAHVLEEGDRQAVRQHPDH